MQVLVKYDTDIFELDGLPVIHNAVESSGCLAWGPLWMLEVGAAAFHAAFREMEGAVRSDSPIPWYEDQAKYDQGKYI